MTLITGESLEDGLIRYLTTENTKTTKKDPCLHVSVLFVFSVVK